jgi:hypothetical protein
MGKGSRLLVAAAAIGLVTAPLAACRGGSADLYVIYSNATPNPVPTGGELTYDATVYNAGPDTAATVTVDVSLSTTLDIVSVGADSGGCTVSGHAFHCDLGDVPAGGTAGFVVIARVSAPAGVGVGAFATFSSPTPDPQPDDTTDAIFVEVEGVTADLVASGSADPEPVPSGGQLTYRVYASNDGPRDASDVFLDLTLPDPVELILVEPDTGSCSGGLTTVQCAFGSVAVGGFAGVTVTVRVTAPEGEIIHAAATFVAPNDPDTYNNSVDIASLVAPPTSVA